MKRIRRHFVGTASDEQSGSNLRQKIAFRSASGKDLHNLRDGQIQKQTHPAPLADAGQPLASTEEAVSNVKQGLWKQAYSALSASKPGLVKAFESLVQDDAELSSVSDDTFSIAVTKKRDELLGKQWSLKFMNHDMRVREQLQRMTRVIQYAQGFGAVVANIDPVHAGIPWAGINILLTVGSSHLASPPLVAWPFSRISG